MTSKNGSAAPWTGQIVVLIPAHNEEGSIQQALTALNAQTVPADRIIVIADNCTDRTAELARATGGGWSGGRRKPGYR